jgi:ribonuclease PH
MSNNELRPVKITTGFQRSPAGSALIECGNTRVICAASVLEEVPPWMRAQKVEGGWVTAEYQMLPSSTATRSRRENKSGPGGRSSEIQRLIGRSLRGAVDMQKLGPRTIHIDCDVLDADGGTRCASITGGMVALNLAVKKLLDEGLIDESPIIANVAAVSVGMVKGEPVLDLCYEEDVAADVDMNVVMGEEGKLIEVQATAEGEAFSRKELDGLLDLAEKGIKELLKKQEQAIA